ncbi:probable LRR receptor-like serine/threonine-protein kinase IRK [Amaranthus tricolor]|uniref:probable LRR receptor-like serine/threonine-protein kinase IRK n=1 Tax=Amaranthus tricolor TaxID=29722 RepID=UPI0025871AED|nr:probable LRR receptor-like serine/threonine-protein kinase IRK [Amaranthus tricolor]
MLVKFLLFVLVLQPSVIVLCLDAFNDDVLGLIVFKAGLQDPESNLVSWNENDEYPCKWKGINCDSTSNRVTELNLDGFSLSGQISRGLLRLQFLQKITLSNNNFSGTINPEFAHLWSLQSIDLSGNNLSGSIPIELFQQCGSLKSVSFANNGISGMLPDSLSSCMTLQSINFSSNQISGQLPEKIWSLNGLQSLDLSNNLLEGEIPQGFGKMYSLKVINLEKNAFSGLLPEDIGSCMQLQSINFGKNSFSGVLPESLQKLNMCTSLSLNGNLLSSEVPDWIGHMQSLESLDLSMNQFFGRIPFTLGNIKSLKELNFSSNGFINGLPQSLMNCDNLFAIDVSLNMLKGKMPNWIFGLGLQKFSISGNKFKGFIEFPPVRTNALSYQNLQILDLSLNELSGGIPSEIGAFRGLQFLNISRNLLIGSVPGSVGDLKITQVIDLSYNRLNGSIPPEIGGAVALRELRLEGNRLTGHIPSQIANCSSLTALILSENNLTGQIPPTIAKLADLEIADLSHNNFSGDLPKELTNLSHLVLFNISNNNLEGELPVGGFFDTIPLSSVYGNPSLCGSVVKQSCPAVHPKPIVLNPNSSSDSEDDNGAPNSHHKKLMLSVSALIAIGAAAFIFLGVVIISLLNFHVRNSAHQSAAPLEFFSKDEFSHSPTSDSQYGKLVMFSGEADFGTGAQALLNKDSELGRGGFGVVYHTVLGDGRSVAIKKLNIASLIKSQEEFEKEVKKIGKVRHQNLVALEGYYWTPSLQLLINEFVPGGSLFKHLHENPSDAPLSWHQRFNIIVGVAKALAHLHQMNIIHYNLKSSNILIDNSDEAKVGDFGLARLLPMLDRYILSSKIQSALGYMAPEFACKTVKITEKCDVYGFGILILEVVTGRKPVEYMEDDVTVLSEMVRGALEEGNAEGCIDQRLHGNFVAEEVIPVIKLGLICASQVPSNRPDMTEVVNILELIQCPSEGRVEEIEQV